MIRFFSWFGAAQKLRDKGDAARDRRNWIEAAGLYVQYLTREPKAAEIWVQYGHALKEMGELGAAEQAYLQARSLEPANSDTRLQMGHLYKLKGDFQAAVLSYKCALKLNPALSDAVRELRGLGVAEDEFDLIDGREAE